MAHSLVSADPLAIYHPSGEHKKQRPKMARWVFPQFLQNLGGICHFQKTMTRANILTIKVMAIPPGDSPCNSLVSPCSQYLSCSEWVIRASDIFAKNVKKSYPFSAIPLAPADSFPNYGAAASQTVTL